MEEWWRWRYLFQADENTADLRTFHFKNIEGRNGEPGRRVIKMAKVEIHVC